MSPLLFIPYYIHWHYFNAPQNIMRITGNFLWFTWNFFSIGLLLRTLFDPLMRLQEAGPKGFDIQGFFSTLIINTIVRCTGAVVRAVFIVMGLIVLSMIIVLSFILLCVWIILPILLVCLVLLGFGFIFNLI